MTSSSKRSAPGYEAFLSASSSSGGLLDTRGACMNERAHIDMPGAREMDAIIALLEGGQAEEALDALDALQAAHPVLTAGLLAFRAAILSHLERYEEALACYDRLLDRQRPRSIY